MSELISQTSFNGETSGGVAKYRVFSHATFSAVFFFCMALPYVPVCYGLKIQILLKSLALSQEIELRPFKLKKNYRP